MLFQHVLKHLSSICDRNTPHPFFQPLGTTNVSPMLQSGFSVSEYITAFSYLTLTEHPLIDPFSSYWYGWTTHCSDGVNEGDHKWDSVKSTNSSVWAQDKISHWKTQVQLDTQLVLCREGSGL